MRIVSAIGLGTLGVLAACRSLAGPDALPVQLEAAVDAVRVDSARQRVHARLLFTIRNQRRVPISYLACNHVVLRDSAATSRIVARAPFCIESSPRVELATGEQRTDTMKLTLGDDVEAGSPDGTFRLGTYIFGPESGTGNFRTTPSFKVNVP